MDTNLENCLEFKGLLTFNEFKKSHFYCIRKKSLIFVSVLFTIYYVLLSHIEYENAMSLSILLSVGVLAICYLISFIIVKISFNKNPLTKFQQYYTINSDGIFIKSKKSSLKLLWKNIVTIHEYDDIFIIKISYTHVLTIPKRYFNSDKDIKNFINIILSNEDKISRIILK
ncbi:YcxB family protein [Clostridium massiliodielmoense]|uniref:YcxB family protein n=1 Tax=Clostridium massiliodielmoense TaxID=1776385 RepID=UPI000A271BC1|nr:YcxB family protein [Clostridium massiliodielmoense]